jgi:hypothetical protein
MYPVECDPDDAPARACHPDGDRARVLADLDARRQIALTRRTDVALVRSRRLDWIRSLQHPLFTIPALGTLGHLLAWMI